MQKRKVQVLEQKLESAYGKGSKLLLKAGGDNFALGEGMGKHNQGILNPVKNTLQQAKGGVGFDRGGAAPDPRAMLREAEAFADKPKVADINMDIYDKEGAEEKVKQIEQ